MSSRQKQSGQIDDAQQWRLFQLLDAYCSTPSPQREGARAEVLGNEPGLAQVLDCLDSLERLAPPPPQAEDSNRWWGATQNFGSPAERVGQASTRPQRVPCPFGKYQLLAEIGRGGMGVVYKARQIDLDRTVAIKMILASQFASDQAVRRFYDEARAAGSIRHPHIVGIHEVGEIHGQHFFTMDFIEGRSLAEILQQGPLDPEQAARILAAVAGAVDALHRHDMVHRDLKPANLLLDQEGHPYLADFGLAKVLDGDHHTQTGAILGTPSYMAPEQAAGRNEEVSPRTDVYALGAILYEMLTGRPPFRQPRPMDTLLLVLEGEATLPRRLNARIPSQLELICMRCLEKNPAQRYPSAAHLADDLQRYLRKESIEAKSSGPFQTLRRWARRQPVLVSHLALLLPTAAIVQAMHWYDPGDVAFHLQIMAILALWVAASCLFQLLLPLQPNAIRYGWSAGDAIFLTTVVYLARPEIGPLLIGYPLLIAASGLFFRLRLVVFTTLISLAGYLLLLLLRQEPSAHPHYRVIFGTLLAILGFVVGYQVHRVRILSRYYEERRMP